MLINADSQSHEIKREIRHEIKYEKHHVDCHCRNTFKQCEFGCGSRNTNTVN